MHRGMFYKRWSKTTKTYFRVYDPTIRVRPQYSTINSKHILFCSMLWNKSSMSGILRFCCLKGLRFTYRTWFDAVVIFLHFIKEKWRIARSAADWNIAYRGSACNCAVVKFYLTFWMREYEHRTEKTIGFL